MKKLLVCCLFCLLCPARWVLAEALPVSLSVSEAPVGDVLRTMASLSGENVIVDPQLRQTITLELHDVPFDTALDMVTRSQGLSCRRLGSLLLVSSQSQMDTYFGSLSTHALQYIPVQEAAKTLQPLFSSPLACDSVTNTLLFNGSPGEKERLEQALAALDKPTKQITLQAKILSLQEEASKELGLRWDWSRIPYRDSGGDEDYGGRIHLGHGYGARFQSTLSALCQQGKAKVLANPSIITLPGKEASIFIGDHIPVVTEKITNSTTSTTTEYVDAGIRLSYTPVLSQDGLITAKVHTEVSTPTLITEMKNYRITSRTADTNVRLREKETLVIGGLISEEEQKRLAEVPLLAKLPLLGELFKFRSRSKTKTEVCMLLTPYVSDPGDSPAIYEGVKEK